jgi:16S rRNA (cytosine1402-N4)-methyltransferase
MNEMHVPVLLQQTLKYLMPKKGDKYLDLTAGYGGHASVMMEHTQNYDGALLVDRDGAAVSYLQNKYEQKVSILQMDFGQAVAKLVSQNQQFDLILADLGVSSPHLDQASRGFSFQSEGPLDMRMDTSRGSTAADLCNGLDESELARIIYEYGEDPKSRSIAKAIVLARPIENTLQLANLVLKVVGRSKKHPATRTFQALRIAVNDELGQLKTALELLPEILAPGGRLGIITFHSLEDRLVKNWMKDNANENYDATFTDVSHGAVGPDDLELCSNPRSRSAKLRVAVKK